MNWVTNLDIKAKTIKVLEGNIENLCDFGLGKDIFDRVQKCKHKRKIIWIWSNLKTCSSEDTEKKTKRQAISFEKIFAKYISDKGLVSRIY